MHEAEFESAPELQPQIKQSSCEDAQAFFCCDVESRSAATLGKSKNGVGARSTTWYRENVQAAQAAAGRRS
jgi:hypothetical protein